jgi:E3 ubiquitin-protein ligase UBR1
MDAFQFMVQMAMVYCPIMHVELRHALRLSLTVEMMRVVIAFMSDPTGLLRAAKAPESRYAQSVTEPETRGVKSLVAWLSKEFSPSSSNIPACHVLQNTMEELSTEGLHALCRLCKAYALAFLRKSVIFCYVAQGVDFPTTAGSEASLPELDRLVHFLQLPALGDILLEFDEFAGRTAIKGLAALWVADSLAHEESLSLKQLHVPLIGIKLLHPAPLELIGLPKHFDALLEESHRWKCPTTGKEVSDPALCLFCGQIFCSQTVCCLTKDLRGGCNAHLEKCSSPIGMFLFIRKCHVALLHVVKAPRLDVDRDRTRRSSQASNNGLATLNLSHGSFFAAPYLTKHGETDSGLRSKHQLILSQKRYDKLLRDTWLMTNGSVWSTIARKLEGEVNAGGWETL